MINLFHLKYFADAAKYGGFAASAQRNHVSQSAVSQAIKALEEQLGLELVIHGQNRFAITPAGQRILDAAPQVFNAVASLKTAGTSGSETFDLRIGTTTSLALEWIPHLLKSYRREHPKAKVQIEIGNSETIRSWLKEGRIDLGFAVHDGGSEATLQRHEVYQGQYHLFTSAAGPKRPTQLEEEGVIVTRAERSEVKELRRQFRTRFQRALPINMEVVSWEVIRTYVRNLGGYGFCPDYVIEKDLKAGRLRKVSRLKKPITYDLVVLVPKKKPMTSATGFFIELCRELA